MNPFKSPLAMAFLTLLVAVAFLSMLGDGIRALTGLK